MYSWFNYNHHANINISGIDTWNEYDHKYPARMCVNLSQMFFLIKLRGENLTNMCFTGSRGKTDVRLCTHTVAP